MAAQLGANVACLFFAAFFSGVVLAEGAVGLVTGVSDGDTFYVLIDGRSTRVRLSSIDAPEKKQPFGRVSEGSLRELVGQKTVTLTWHKKDRYGRPIVQVEAGGIDVNAEQIRRGMAWAYRRYTAEQRLYSLEDEARRGRLGLWADPAPVAPWLWRRGGGRIDLGKIPASE